MLPTITHGLPTSLWARSIPQSLAHIIQFQDIYWIRLRGVNAFSLKFHPGLAFPPTASRILDMHIHPLHQRLVRRYEVNLAAPLLRWTCTCKTAASGGRVVRSWQARRFRMQFVQSLREMGYARDGTRLDASDGVASLVGTAAFFPETVMLKMSIPDLRAQVDMALRDIIRRQATKPGKPWINRRPFQKKKPKK